MKQAKQLWNGNHSEINELELMAQQLMAARKKQQENNKFANLFQDSTIHSSSLPKPLPKLPKKRQEPYAKTR
jgi:hypothetical protein